jgi:type III pantothenate kinase
MMLLVDVGNTHTVYGLRSARELVARWRQSTDGRRTADEHRVFLRGCFSASGFDLDAVNSACIASVVPEATEPLCLALRSMVGDQELLVVGPGVRTGVPVRVDHPREVGADRIVNAAGAFDLYASALIIVDFGTATTFDVVAEDGAYLGGAIAPGLQSSHDALVRRASKLRRVDVAAPSRATGRSTEEAMQSGLYFGYAGLVSGLVKRLLAEHKAVRKVVATGGLAQAMAAVCPEVNEVVEDLTLHGLWCIWHRQTRREGRV